MGADVGNFIASEDDMNATRQLHDLGQKPLAREHYARSADKGHTQRTSSAIWRPQVLRMPNE